MPWTRAFLLSLLWSVLAFAQQETKPATDDGDDFIVGAALDPEACNLSNAKPVTFRDVAGRLTDAEAQCVAVTAYWSGRALFPTAADGRRKLSNVTEKLKRRRIGLYASERLLASAPQTPTKYTVVGQLRHCETAWPKAMMVLGYCHYTGGPFLIVSEIRQTS